MCTQEVKYLVTLAEELAELQLEISEFQKTVLKSARFGKDKSKLDRMQDEWNDVIASAPSLEGLV